MKFNHKLVAWLYSEWIEVKPTGRWKLRHYKGAETTLYLEVSYTTTIIKCHWIFWVRGVKVETCRWLNESHLHLQYDHYDEIFTCNNTQKEND